MNAFARPSITVFSSCGMSDTACSREKQEEEKEMKEQRVDTCSVTQIG